MHGVRPSAVGGVVFHTLVSKGRVLSLVHRSATQSLVYLTHTDFQGLELLAPLLWAILLGTLGQAVPGTAASLFHKKGGGSSSIATCVSIGSLGLPLVRVPLGPITTGVSISSLGLPLVRVPWDQWS